MALEFKLGQKLGQSLVMTPQLQQAIKLLQLGRQEFIELLENQLLENPTLEESGIEDRPSAKAESSSENQLSDYNKQNAEDAKPWEMSQYEGGDSAFKVKRTNSEGEFGNFLENNASEVGLVSHLLWQLRTSEIAENDYQIANHLIGNLDNNGYLQVSLEEVAEETARPISDVEEVLSLIQSFDPAGIAARDLSECLLIQLEHQGLKESLAGRIVQKHLGLLEIKNVEEISKQEKVSLEQIGDAIRVIQSLEPRPGRPFIDEAPVFISPDIYIRKINDQFMVTLNDTGIPQLKVSDDYKKILGGLNKSNSKIEKEYLKNCIKSANWLLKSLNQRQQTILKVSNSIVKHQQEFFEKGRSALKPLTLKEIARDVSMHESTISRVTTNKYVNTPQGVFELKFFFSSSLKAEGGDVSAESVKNTIKNFVAEESGKKPLSDQQLVNMLKDQGIEVARRTVAKYRESLGILPSSKRKKINC